MRARRRDLWLLLLMVLPACGGSDAALLLLAEPGLTTSNPRMLVGSRGDQLLPALQDSVLVWFDLSADPNGACFSGTDTASGTTDDSCQGKIRAGDLETGRVWDLSATLDQMTRPVVNDGRVAFRCRQDYRWGTCVTPVDRQEVSFLPDRARDSWYRYNTWPYDNPPAVHSRGLVWLGYHYISYIGTEWAFRLTDPNSGQDSGLLDLEQAPVEWRLFGDQLVWATNRWDGDSYQCRIQTMDLDTGNTRIITEVAATCFGLGAGGGLLAWKQSDNDVVAGEEVVHVLFRDSGGKIDQADGGEARVSTQSAVAVGDDALVWLDYRQGDYQLAARRIGEERDELISDEAAVISGTMEPAVSGRQVVWADRRDGDWDLYLYSF